MHEDRDDIDIDPDDPDQEFLEDDDDPICSGCNGSGEGMYDGSSCYKCHGSGVEPCKKDFEP